MGEDEEGVRYFKLSDNTWDSFSAADWRKSTVSTNTDQFTPVDLLVSSILDDEIYELNGYVRDPVGTLNTLIRTMQGKIDLYQFEMARKYHWTEIMAVMWRDVAQNGPPHERGSVKRVISAVRAYYEGKLEENMPSEGQFRDAVYWLKEQISSSSSRDQVVPNFSKVKAKQKQKSRRARKRAPTHLILGRSVWEASARQSNC